MDYISLFLSILVAILVSFLCIYLLRPVALHIGLVDTPGGRKKHVNPVPLIGGIAIFLGFCFSLLCLNISLQPYRGLLAGSVILLLIGVLDDFHELTPRIRLMGQFLAALLLIQWGHLSVVHLGGLFFSKGLDLGLFALPVTILFVLGLVNAVNMIDGNDGLAAMVVLGQALFLMGFACRFHEMHDAYVLILLCVSLCVFLIFNFPFSSAHRASIFLGDAGSTFIGFVMAWFAVTLSQKIFINHVLAYNPLSVLWVLGFPLFDLLAVILHRFSAGKSPFSAGRDHLHHLLFDCGWSRLKVTVMLSLLSLSLGMIGVGLAEMRVLESWQLIVFLCCFLVYFLVSKSLMLYCTRECDVATM